MHRKARKKPGGGKAPPNNLRQIRESEGLKITDLAELANVSTRTITRIEYRNPNVTATMKNRVLIGLNVHPKRKREYTLQDMFPTETSG
jgi:transcriptional regulator with XRE-family HTH domain